MLRKKKDNSEYEIDRELTWKFAIEKNAEYQDRIAELEEENKKLKEEVRFLEECLDRKEKLNEKYRKEIEKLKAPRNIRNSDEWRKTHPFG
jgi:predicted metallo-beta-lactamase superfamily hydrolase